MVLHQLNILVVDVAAVLDRIDARQDRILDAQRRWL
jgi:hypothetical protein